LKHSLEYYSLHYLDMWLKHDRIYHDALNNGTRAEKLAALKKAAYYYKIARNLPTECDEGRGLERYEPVLKIIDKVVNSDLTENTVKSIEKIQVKISKAYDDRNALSFTTKILWLKMRDPIIIYDSQARIALDIPGGDLSEFYKAWRAEYKIPAKSIASVCAELSGVAKYSYDQTVATTSYVKDISAKMWFQERVFDMYLWHKGQ